MVEVFYKAVCFCQKQEWDDLKTSTYLSILHDLLLHISANAYMKLDADYDYFKRQVLKHAIDRPPWSILVFDRQDIESIWHFTVESVFRYYDMYKHVLTDWLDVSFEGYMVHSAQEMDRQVAIHQEEHQEEEEEEWSEEQLQTLQELVNEIHALAEQVVSTSDHLLVPKVQ